MKVITRVSAVFSAAHVDPMTDAMHGHDYEVIAAFNGDPLRRFEVLRLMLTETLRAFDHTTLAPEQWSAEGIGQALLGILGGDCIEVQVNRPWLGHYVTVTP